MGPSRTNRAWYFRSPGLVLVQPRNTRSDILGSIAQVVTYLAVDTCLTAESRVPSWIPAPFHTFVEIDQEIISTVIIFPPADSRRVVVSYKRKYVHEVLANLLSQACPGKKSG